MIEILTLFFGLVTGPQPVELAVDRQTATVELRLDGQRAKTLAGPPWRTQIDLGEALQPHELVAVARDAGGAELGRARRWINIDPPEVSIGGQAPAGGLTPLPIVLSGGREATPREMSSWLVDGGLPVPVAALDAGPAEVIVVLDPGARRGLEQLAHAYLVHQLGKIGFAAELPADPVAAGWRPDLLRLDEEAFRAAALETFSHRGGAPESRQIGLLWQSYSRFAHLGDDTEVRFLSPMAAPVSRTLQQRQLFMQSAGVPDAGLLWLARKLRPMGFAYRFADAVGVAGREAHAGGRRRAVLLLLDQPPSDDSLYPAPAVRAYLRSLRVPLVVWSLAPETRTPWGDPRFIGFERARGGRTVRPGTLAKTFERYAVAAAELRALLDSQRIAWLGGRRLPQRIEAAPGSPIQPAGLDEVDGPLHGGPKRAPAGGRRKD